MPAFLAAAGGSIASGIGGALAATSQNRAQQTQTQAAKRNAFSGALTQGIGVMGGSYAGLFQKINDAVYAQVEHGDSGPLQAITASPEFAAWQKETGGAAIPQLRALADQYIASGNKELGSYQQDTNTLDQQGKGISGQISNWGAGRAALINTDAAKSLRATNDQTMARANATGFGASSLVPNQLAGNARENELNKQKSLQTLSEGQIDRSTGQANQNLGMLANRMQGKTSLWGSLQDRNLGLQTAPINMQTGTLTNIGNTFSGQPAYPGGGQSAGGSALSNIGNAAAQFGSMGMLASMYGGGGGGGGGRPVTPYDVGPTRANGNFNKGGMVPGPNINADIVPAKLTPGEYVMDRDEVAKARKGIPPKIVKNTAKKKK